MSKDDQEVLVVERDLLFAVGGLEGFRPSANLTWFQNFLKGEGFFMRRGDIEDSPCVKQIIPQVAVIHDKKLFVHKIPETGGEGRLHGKCPIFLGGHMEPMVGGGQESITRAAWREVSEEIGEIEYGELQFLGFVHTEATPVSAVHFGVVFAVVVDEPYGVNSTDEGISEGGYASLEEIEARWDYLTEWSQLAFPAVKEFVHALD